MDLLPKINRLRTSASEPFALIVVFLMMISGFSLWMLLGHRSPAEATTNPLLITFQGKLTDQNRITVPDSALNVKFAIYDASLGGTCFWSAKNTDSNTATIDCPSDVPGGAISVTPTEGVVSVLLGDTTASQNLIPTTLFNAHADLWLGITVGGDAEMSPRIRLTSTPYAFYSGDSDKLDGLDSSAFATSATAFFQNGNSFGTAAVLGTNDNNTLSFEINNATKMTIDTTGFVGIGTATPDHDLTISRNTNAQMALRSFGTGVNPSLELVNSRGTAASPSAVLTGDGIGDIDFCGQLNGTVDNYTCRGIIQGIATEDWAPGAAGNQMRFFTTPNTTSTALVRMTIDEDGNVGIGTTNPSEPLHILRSTSYNAGAHVTGTGNFAALYATNDNNSSSSQIIAFGSTASGTMLGVNRTGMVGLALHPDTSVSGAAVIRVDNASPLVLGTNDTERMRIDSSGNVGIGDSTPDAFVEVEKNQNASTVEALTNTTSGSSAAAYFQFTAGTTNTYFGSYSQGFTDNAAFTGFGTLENTANGLLFSAGNTGGIIKFFTDGSLAANERMRITAGGNVGIGTTSPNNLLTVDTDGSATTPSLAFDSSDSNTGIYHPASDNLAVATNGTQTALFGKAGTDDIFTVTGGTLASTKRVLNVTATLPNSASTQVGVINTITSGGSGAGAQGAFETDMLAGYTGSSSSYGVIGTNAAAGTNTGAVTLFGSPTHGGNYGSYFQSSASTAGNNLGTFAFASGSSTLNVGGLFDATQSTNTPAANAAVIGRAGNATASVGGYFDLVDSSGTHADITYATAALIADNTNVAAPVFIARDNGSEKFAVIDGGALEVAEITAPGTPSSGFGRVYEKSDNLLYFKNDAGTEFDLTSVGGGSSLQTAYNGGATITTASSTDIAFTLASGNFVVKDSGGTAMTTFTGSTGAVAFANSVALGDSNADTISVTGRIDTPLIPTTNNTLDIGDDTHRWNDLFVGPGSLHVGTSDADGATISYDTSANTLNLVNNTNTELTIGPSTGDIVTVTGGTLATGKTALNVTGTLSSTNAIQFGEKHVLTSAGSSGNTNQERGMEVELLGGYVGSGGTMALNFTNLAAGTATGAMDMSVATQASGNLGIAGTTASASAGNTVAILGSSASSSTLNIGVEGKQTDGATTGALIGAAGIANSGGSASSFEGGFFGITSGSFSSFPSAALVADNGNSTSPIFLARDGSSTVLTIADGGTVTATGNVVGNSNFTFGDASGDTVTSNAATWTFANDTAVALTGGVNGLNFDSNTLSIDATNNRIGIGTAAPSYQLHVFSSSGGTIMAADSTSTANGSLVRLQNDTGAVLDLDMLASSQSGTGGAIQAASGLITTNQGALNIQSFKASSPSIGFYTATSSADSGTERARIGETEFVVNDASNNYDFRVETDGNANGIFVDASAETIDLVGGSGSTGCSVDASGNLTCSGSVTSGGVGFWTLDGTGQTITADKNMTLSGGVNGLSFDNTTLSIDAANDRVGFGTTTPASTIDAVAAQTGAASTTSYNFTVTTSGTGSNGVFGIGSTLSAGFTGSGFTAAGYFYNQLAGTNTTYGSDAEFGYLVAGNRGVEGLSTGTTTGHNVGGLFIATRGDRNYGSWSSSTVPKSGGTNVGAIGFGLNTGGGGAVQVGGYFSLFDPIANTAPTIGTSAALIADNGSQTSDIFSARDNHTAVLTIADGGTVTATGNVVGNSNFTFGDASGDTVTSNAATWTFANDTAVALTGGVNGINFDSDTLSIDATNNRIGLGTASPSARLHVAHGTLASVSDHALIVSGTFLDSASSQDMEDHLFTSAGSGGSQQTGLYIDLAAGYTGNFISASYEATNEAKGTGTGDPRSLSLFASGFNVASWGVTSPATAGTGTNIGSYGVATLGALTFGSVGQAGNTGGGTTAQDSTDIGVVGVSTAAKNGSSTTEKHVGVTGQALNGDVNVGGYFGLQSAVPTYASAALMADNGAVAADIFVARDNGTAVFTIADGGSWSLPSDVAVSLGGGVNGINFDSNTLSIDATNDRVGIGTAAPSTALHILTNQNGDTALAIENQTNGTAADTQIYLSTVSGFGSIAAFPSAYTAGGTFLASKMAIYNQTLSGGLIIGDGASGGGGVYITTNGTPDSSLNRAHFKSTGEVVFNDPGNDYDFRVETDGNANGIFLDASAETIDLVGGSGSTGCTVDASGNLSCTGTLSGSGGGFWTLDGTSQTVTADKNMTLSGGVNGLSFDGTTFSVDATNDRVGFGTAAPSHKVDIVGGTLGAGVNALHASGTLSGASGEQGVRFDVTGAGSGAINIEGVSAVLAAGSYTGTQVATALEATTTTVGTGNNFKFDTSFSNPFGNSGLNAFSAGTTTGLNIGSYAEASNGTVSVGAVGKSITAKNSGTNIGTIGVALNTGTTPIQVGGFFGLMNSTPTFTSAALMADNGSQTSDIFVARDNGTPVFTIADGGIVSTTADVGVGTASPIAIGDRNLTVSSTGGTNNSASIIAQGRQVTTDAAFASLEFYNNASRQATIQAMNDGGATTTRLDFYVSNAGSDNVQVMTVDSSGSVGIGTTSPTSMLHVKTTNTTQPQIEVEATGDVRAGVEVLTANASRSSFMDVTNSSGSATFQLAARGTSAAGVSGNFLGVSLNDAADLKCSGATNCLIGSDSAIPLIFGTNDATRLTIAAGGQVTINADGTAAAPALAFGSSSDPNTGFYHPAADNLAVTTNGVQTVLWGSAGVDNIETITGGTLAVGKQVFGFTATFSPSASSQIASTPVVTTTSTTGNGQGSQYGMIMTLANGGWNSNVGNSSPLVVENDAVGTGTWNPLAGGETAGTDVANHGFWSETLGSTAGTNIGGRNQAILGAISIGAVNGVWNGGQTGSSIFRLNSLDIGSVNFVTAAKNGSSTTERHVGVTGQALGGDVNVGGYFGLQSGAPTFASAALMSDNGSTSSDIFVARDNGTPVFTIADGGTVTATNNVLGNGNFTFGDASGDSVTSNAATWSFPSDTAVSLGGGVNGINFDSNTLSIDATNNRIGIGTATPLNDLHVERDANAFIGEYVVNPNAGAGAASSLYLTTSSTFSNGQYLGLFQLGPSYTTDGLWVANQSVIGGNHATAGMLFYDEGVSAPMIFATGGHQSQNERLRIGITEAVFNDNSQNFDFRVETDTNANGIFLDASAETIDLVGGSGSTGCSVDASGNFTCTGTISGSGGGSFATRALDNLASVAINTSLLPATDDSIDLGDNTHRWANSFLGGQTLHIGASTTDEGTIAYTNSTNLFTIGTDATGAGDLVFSPATIEAVRIKATTGLVGIGDSTPDGQLDVTASQPASVGTNPGTNATDVLSISGATGGNTTIATTGTGGEGSDITMITGAGGVASAATTASTGGSGGDFAWIGGNGGAASVTGGTKTGGVGGIFDITGGTGGATSGTGTSNNGGLGGAVNLTAGNGGTASGATSNVGGTGGSVVITAGNGASSNGSGGNVLLMPGTANGSGTTGRVGANDATPDAIFDVDGSLGTILMATNSGTGAGFRINDDGTDTDSTPFIIDASGNVGIGTASPNAILDVEFTGHPASDYNTYFTVTDNTTSANQTIGNEVEVTQAGNIGSGSDVTIGYKALVSNAGTITSTEDLYGGQFILSGGTSGTQSGYGLSTSVQNVDVATGEYVDTIVGGTTGYGLYVNDVESSGSAYGIFVNNVQGSSAATSYAAILNGLVGINTATPSSQLQVTGTTPASVATSSGTAATDTLTVSGVTGGTTTISTTGTGGEGSDINLTTGAGGLASSASTSSTGGGGGDFTLTGGTGGAATTIGTTRTGGAGGTFSLTAGNGATGSGGTTNNGGAGGSFTISAGTGGTGATNGGNGGVLTLNGGSGGSANGDGGNIVLNAGAANGSGTAGQIVISDSGSATVTALGWSGDPDTGLFHAAAGVLDFAVDGTTSIALGDTEMDLQTTDGLRLNFNQTATIAGVCHSGTDSDTTAVNRYLVVCSNTPNDIAEMYETTGAEAPADIVVATPATLTYTADHVDAATGSIAGTDTLTASVLAKSSSSYQDRMIGVVSTSPAQVYGRGVTAFAAHPQAIAVTGRVPVKVSGENGSIQPGDPITSSSIAGTGMKATQPGMIIGYALDSFAGPGTGSILLYVEPSFHMADAIEQGATGNATSGTPGIDSFGLAFRGSGWDGAAAQLAAMKLVTAVASATDYKLSIRNSSDAEVAYITDNGAISVSSDVIVGGKLFPSAQGVAQTDKYIFYGGAGDDFMRTNATGWGTGSYDFAEMFPSRDALEPGDVVAIDTAGVQAMKKADAQDLDHLAGIVSTKPGFLAGDNKAGDHAIALAGRVPVKVTAENGAIAVGDALTVSQTRPGSAMKATTAGTIIGYALEPASQDGEVVAFVHLGYWPGTGTQPNAGTVNGASNVNGNLTSLNMSGNIYMAGNQILNVGAIAGLNQSWSVDAEGKFVTEGSYKTVITSYQEKKVETASVLSTEQKITLSGTGHLTAGTATIRFEDANPDFNDITSTTAPVRVLVTLRGPANGIYVAAADHDGFTAQETMGGTSDADFDWFVEAYRKDEDPPAPVPADPVEPPPADAPPADAPPADTTTPLPDTTTPPADTAPPTDTTTPPADTTTPPPDTTEPSPDTTTP